MNPRKLFQESKTSPSLKSDPSFPTNPFLFSPIILILVATLLILGFLVGLSCRNHSQSSEFNSISRPNPRRRQSFQSDLIFGENFSGRQERGLSIGVDFSNGRNFTFNSCKKYKKIKQDDKPIDINKINNLSEQINKLKQFNKNIKPSTLLI